MCIRVLVVDDDETICLLLGSELARHGYRVDTAPSVAAMRDILQHFYFDAILLDLTMPVEDGFAGLRYLVKEYPNTKVFIITASASLDNAIGSMRQGAAGFFVKPFCFEKVIKELENCLTKSQPMTPTINGDVCNCGFVGRSRAIQAIRDSIERMKDVDSTVLILGESGTGKELVARALHRRSRRAAYRFEAINCGAIPENLLESGLFGHRKGAFTDAKADHHGLFEVCSGGSLLLDEIGELPLRLQVKILRALQEKEITPLGSARSIKIDTRIMAATNRDLKEEVAAQRFRHDLFFRLSILMIVVPPLRERREDIPLLIKEFIQQFNQRFGKTLTYPANDVLVRLCAYGWPGNVRELKNAIERGVVLAPADELQLADMLGDNVTGSHMMQVRSRSRPIVPLNMAKEAFEAEYLTVLLAATEGNISEAARLAGRYRADMYDLLAKHNISPVGFRGNERSPKN